MHSPESFLHLCDGTLHFSQSFYDLVHIVLSHAFDGFDNCLNHSETWPCHRDVISIAGVWNGRYLQARDRLQLHLGSHHEKPVTTGSTRKFDNACKVAVRKVMNSWISSDNDDISKSTHLRSRGLQKGQNEHQWKVPRDKSWSNSPLRVYLLIVAQYAACVTECWVQAKHFAKATPWYCNLMRNNLQRGDRMLYRYLKCA